MKLSPLRSRLPHGISVTALLILALCWTTPHAAPVQQNWSGSVIEVFVDEGTTDFSGTGIGAPFSGFFIYDDQPGDPDPACDIEFCEWFYTGAPYGAEVNGFSNSGSSLLIENDQDLSENPDDLPLINELIDPDIDENTPFDIWELSSEIQPPGDLFEIVVTWITTDTSTMSDASMFDPMRPFDATPTAGRGIGFFITQITDTGSFAAFGRVTSTEIVPIPASAWLFGSALGFLAWIRRRQQPQA